MFSLFIYGVLTFLTTKILFSVLSDRKKLLKSDSEVTIKFGYDDGNEVGFTTKKKKTELNSTNSYKKIINKNTLVGSLCENIINETKGIIKYLKENQITKDDVSLEKLGFTSAVNYTYKLTADDETLLKTIKFYENHYPNNPFVPKNVIDKYVADTSISFVKPEDYKQKVPSDSIIEMEEFDINLSDITYLFDGSIISYKELSNTMNGKKYIENIEKDGSAIFKSMPGYRDLVIEKNNKKILLVGDKVEAHKYDFKEFIELEKNPNKDIDVIVLQAVENGYLIVTSW